MKFTQWPVVKRLVAVVRSAPFIVAVAVLGDALVIAVRPDWSAAAPYITGLALALILKTTVGDAIAQIGQGKPLDQAAAVVATDIEQAVLPGAPPVTPEWIDAIAAALAKVHEPLLNAIVQMSHEHTVLATAAIQAGGPKPTVITTGTPSFVADIHTPQGANPDPARAAVQPKSDAPLDSNAVG